MGSLQAQEMSEMLSLEDGLAWHLRSNHYPPIPLEMIPVCIEAIDAYNDEDYEQQIDLPDGATWRGNVFAPAWAIVEGHRLYAWVERDELDM